MKFNSRNGESRTRVWNEVRSDCKRWRRLASRCAQSKDWIPPSTDEQYQVVHARILASCQNLAEEESLPEFRRRIVRQLDELLRPWSTPKTLAEAPPHLVEDLVKQEHLLEERLQGRRAQTAVRFRKIVVIACVAGVTGIAITLLLNWMSSESSRGFTESLFGVMAGVTSRIRGSSFTEQFAVAVLLSWIFGTWLLSNVYKS